MANAGLALCTAGVRAADRARGAAACAGGCVLAAACHLVSEVIATAQPQDSARGHSVGDGCYPGGYEWGFAARRQGTPSASSGRQGTPQRIQRQARRRTAGAGPQSGSAGRSQLLWTLPALRLTRGLCAHLPVHREPHRLQYAATGTYVGGGARSKRSASGRSCAAARLQEDRFAGGFRTEAGCSARSSACAGAKLHQCR